MKELNPGLSATPAVLTVEIDVEQVLSGRQPPAALQRAQAESLLNAVAADLSRILGPEIESCGLIMSAGLYDLTELVRPGLPAVETLFELYRGSLRHGEFQAQLVALGAQGEDFPVEALRPQRRPGSGPMLALPLLFVGQRHDIARVQTRLEAVLLERGRAGFQTEQLIRRDFGLAPENLAYATLNDICALLKIQLGHGGLGELWTLLEGALYRPEDPVDVTLPSRNRFLLRDGRVHTPYFTFDDWAAAGGTLEDYLGWLKQQRLYEAGLAVHGLALRRLDPGADLEPHCSGKWAREADVHALPEGEVLREPAATVGDLTGAAAVTLTEHATPELGPVAYTVVVQAADGAILYQANLYPLRSGALRRIVEEWRQRALSLGLELGLLRPGSVTVDAAGRRLAPAPEARRTH